MLIKPVSIDSHASSQLIVVQSLTSVGHVLGHIVDDYGPMQRLYDVVRQSEIMALSALLNKNKFK